MTTTSGDEPIRLGDRYELGGLLGRGGMADVRVGRDLRLGRTVAVKQLRADLASDDTFQARFRREAQSAAALNHPAIVAVYDTGEAANAHGDHIPYIVMEYVEGQTLREVMRDGRKILPERALSITADVLSALDYSHRSGIIHRDIKPANVMLTPAGQVKVMDFGIARAIADASSAMTQTAAVIGTAQYLSPEQARGEAVDARSDIYSTGCLLYELLTGRPPFVGDSPVSVAYQHVREEPRPPSQLNPDVSQTVDNIVAKALAKRVDDRYQSAGDMRRDIERALAGHGVDAPTATTAVVGATSVAPTIPAAAVAGGSHRGPDNPEEERGSNAKIWLLALLALLLLGGVAWGVYQATRPDPPAQVTVPDVVNKEVDVATRMLTDKGFTVGDPVMQPSDDVKEGLVISQDPSGGTSQNEGTEVTLTVSSGREVVSVPNVVDLNFDEAKSTLESDQYGFKVKKKERDDAKEKGTVIQTNPTAGQNVPKGTTITVYVSKGQVPVPDLVGMTEEAATKALKDLDLKADIRKDPDAIQPQGQVTAQSRPTGQNVPPGTTIVLTVSDNPGDEEPPEPETPSGP